MVIGSRWPQTVGTKARTTLRLRLSPWRRFHRFHRLLVSISGQAWHTCPPHPPHPPFPKFSSGNAKSPRRPFPSNRHMSPWYGYAKPQAPFSHWVMLIVELHRPLIPSMMATPQSLTYGMAPLVVGTGCRVYTKTDINSQGTECGGHLVALQRTEVPEGERPHLPLHEWRECVKMTSLQDSGISRR